MSNTTLKPSDLIHGGLYRSKETGVIGRLNASGRFIFYVDLLPRGGKFIFERDRWEPIPITTDILKEFFEIKQGVEFPVKDGWYSLQFFFRKGNIEALYMKTKSGANPIPIQIPESIHELQRLVLALTGYRLEGGPK